MHDYDSDNLKTPIEAYLSSNASSHPLDRHGKERSRMKSMVDDPKERASMIVTPQEPSIAENMTNLSIIHASQSCHELSPSVQLPEPQVTISKVEDSIDRVSDPSRSSVSSMMSTRSYNQPSIKFDELGAYDVKALTSTSSLKEGGTDSPVGTKIGSSNPIKNSTRKIYIDKFLSGYKRFVIPSKASTLHTLPQTLRCTTHCATASHPKLCL
jgi:hypothetical protein